MQRTLFNNIKLKKKTLKIAHCPLYNLTQNTKSIEGVSGLHQSNSQRSYNGKTRSCIKLTDQKNMLNNIQISIKIKVGAGRGGAECTNEKIKKEKKEKMI